MELQNQIRQIREQTGMNRRQFCERTGIPYQTVTDWELGHRTAPDYVVRLLEYYVQREILEDAPFKDEMQSLKDLPRWNLLF